MRSQFPSFAPTRPSAQAKRVRDLITEAESHFNAGRFAEAAALAQQARDAHTSDARALRLLALVHHQRGDHTEAAQYACEAARLNQDPNLLALAGECCRLAGRAEEAIDYGEQALQQRPRHAATLNNLGLAHQDAGDFETAERYLREALNANPNYPSAFQNLGVLFLKVSRLDAAEAAFRRALTLRPNYAQALNGLGVVAQRRYQHQTALQAIRKALHLQPRYPQAWLNLSNSLIAVDRLAEAEQALNRALSHNPKYAKAYHDLGALYERQRRSAEACDAYASAFQLDPDDPRTLSALLNARRHLCDWQDRAAQTQQLFAAVDRCLAAGQPNPLWPSASLRLPTTATQRLQIARDYASRIDRGRSPVYAPQTSSAQDKPIRVGFLSHEFGEFIVSHTMQGIYRSFDRSRFQIHAFSYGPGEDSPIRQRIRGDVDRFVDVADATPDDAARQVAEAGIQILVDINSYMPGGRPEIAARRPAPIQVSYRYPGTSGSDFIDYLLMDEIAVPPTEAEEFTEAPVFLPIPYLVTSYEGEPPSGETMRSDFDLPEDAFVFCSFNQSHKLTPDLFDVWMRLLRNVPGAVIWQLEQQEAIRDNLRREAEARGVASERLAFTGKLPIEQHLARYQHADLFLDTLVHGAIVTALDALWCGVPILTISGDSFTSRAPASLITAAGLPELICKDLEEYEQRCAGTGGESFARRGIAGDAREEPCCISAV